MQDISGLFRTAQAKSGFLQTLAIEELALAIIELPEGSAIAETETFKKAHALALPQIQQIARRNKKAKHWAGFHVNTENHAAVPTG